MPVAAEKTARRHAGTGRAGSSDPGSCLHSCSCAFMLALCLSLYVSFGRGDVYELLLQLSDADSNSAYITAAGPVQSYNIIDAAHHRPVVLPSLSYWS